MNPEVNTGTAFVNERSSPEILLEVINLKKRFEKQMVLKGVSLSLFKGENLVVMGKSGTGKSVLIKCIGRLLIPDSGTIEVLGNRLDKLNRTGLNKLRQKMGFLFQGGALYDSMTVRQNLEFPLRRIKKGISEKEINNKVIEVLRSVGLPDTLDKMPSELSGGMRKRISLARTIIVDPVIMLYDEPTTGLDPSTADEISSLINDVRKNYDTSSIIITHDIGCARKTADRIIMLHEGEIYAEGSPEELESSSDKLIKSFFK